jgi:hypothetical protein
MKAASLMRQRNLVLRGVGGGAANGVRWSSEEKTVLLRVTVYPAALAVKVGI